MVNRSRTVVFGATGVQGGAVARRLVLNGVPVRALGRNRISLDDLADLGIESLDISESHDAVLDKALEDATDAFVCVPITAGLGQDELSFYRRSIRAALKRSSIKRVVWTSSWLVTAHGLSVSQSFDEVRRDVDLALDLPIETIVIKPGGYLDNLLTPDSIAGMASGNLSYMLPEDFLYRWISCDDQAMLVAAILAQETAVSNEYAIGERVTGVRLAEAAAHALGRDLVYVPISPRDFAEQWREQIGDAADRIAADYLDIASQPAALGLGEDPTIICREFGFRYAGLHNFFLNYVKPRLVGP
jgi:uncharacterized protein YbjT (DUF2867 family)